MENKTLFLHEINPHALVALLLKSLWICVLMCVGLQLYNHRVQPLGVCIVLIAIVVNKLTKNGAV